jgi:hypothetical protein
MCLDDNVFHLQRSGWLTLVHEKFINLQDVLDIRKIILKMTCEKLLTLNNVFYVFDIIKNLVSSSLWRKKNSFKIVFESDKFIL